MGNITFTGDGPTKEEAKEKIGNQYWTEEAEAVFDLLLQKHNPGGDRVPGPQVSIVIDGIAFEFKEKLKSKKEGTEEIKQTIVTTELKTIKERLAKGAVAAAKMNQRMAEQTERWSKSESLAPMVEHAKPKSLKEAKEQCLWRHNLLRARHGAPPLEWSDDLAHSAKSAAQACQHKGALVKDAGGVGAKWSKELGKHGQNRYMGSEEDCYATAIDDWYSQVDDFDFGPKELHRGETTAFTQLVWSKTTHVGMCQMGRFIFANYYPLGTQAVAEASEYVGAITEAGKAEAIAEGVHPRHNPAEKIVRKMFAAADVNKDGSLSAKELEGIMERLGMARKDVNRLMQAADKNHDGSLQIDEFLSWIFSGSGKAGKALERAESTMNR